MLLIVPGLQRSDLQRELVESINNLDANTIHLDSDFSHFEGTLSTLSYANLLELENESKVIVHFRNKPSIKVDFLIAADGIHSPIRNTISQQKNGEGINPVYWYVCPIFRFGFHFIE